MFSESTEVGLSNSDGTITPCEFRQGAHAFAQKWIRVCHDHDHFYPPWSWVSCSNSPLVSSHQVNGYLSMEKMCIWRSDKIEDNSVSHVSEQEHDCLETETSTDPAILDLQASHEVHYYDFHIVYSDSYRIPVLYFRGYNSDGQPLMLDEIEKDLPASSAKVLTESKWTFITQLEHPYLNRPWYSLHPCGTNELMKIMSNNSSVSKAEDAAERYLISWLSVVSQVVGLRIPLQMATSHLM